MNFYRARIIKISTILEREFEGDCFPSIVGMESLERKKKKGRGFCIRDVDARCELLSYEKSFEAHLIFP